MTFDSFKNLTKQETKEKLNAIINYFIDEGMIIEDPISGKIRLTTDEELNNQIENI